MNPKYGLWVKQTDRFVPLLVSATYFPLYTLYSTTTQYGSSTQPSDPKLLVGVRDLTLRMLTPELDVVVEWPLEDQLQVLQRPYRGLLRTKSFVEGTFTISLQEYPHFISSSSYLGHDVGILLMKQKVGRRDGHYSKINS